IYYLCINNILADEGRVTMKRTFLRLHSLISASAILLVLGSNTLRADLTGVTGGTVAQGPATFSGSGSQFNINQTSPTAQINFQTFNIGVGETVNFNQPSSTSVTWNFINDPNPNGSIINGNINAIGYVILQNPNGFSVGGQ